LRCKNSAPDAGLRDYASAELCVVEASNLGHPEGAKHAAQWTATLETYAHPVFGCLPVSAIEIAHVMKVLEPIWATKPVTMDWCSLPTTWN
jgi:hypothetical protein